MSENTKKADDGVNRNGLDYRAGYVEGLIAFMQQLQIASVRARRSEIAGMESARLIANGLRNDMLDKMRNPAPPPEDKIRQDALDAGLSDDEIENADTWEDVVKMTEAKKAADAKLAGK